MNVQNSTNEKYEKEATAQGESPSIEELLARLNDLPGLSNVKAEVNKLVSQIRVFKQRQDLGLPVPKDFSYHLFFTGNPGTDKATVARLMAQIYNSLGILPKDQIIEISAGDLISDYVGHTALKTREMIEKALGGVLFVDDAHTLGGDNNWFGQEALNELVAGLENHRGELIVILAGDTDQMTQLIDSNPGLACRFQTTLEFKE